MAHIDLHMGICRRQYGSKPLTSFRSGCWLTLKIGALIGHCIFFWGGQILTTVKDLRRGGSPDRHHLAMKRYKDTPWWWYTVIMGIAFVFGIVVVLKANVGIGAGEFVAALVVGAIIAPFVSDSGETHKNHGF